MQVTFFKWSIFRVVFHLYVEILVGLAFILLIFILLFMLFKRLLRHKIK